MLSSANMSVFSMRLLSVMLAVIIPAALVGCGQPSSSPEVSTTSPATDALTQNVTADGAVTYFDGNLTWQVEQTNTWESEGKKFIQYNVTLTNNSGKSIDGWQIAPEFSEAVSLTDSWNGMFTVDGSRINIRNASHNGQLKDAESTTDIGFIVSGSSELGLIAWGSDSLALAD